MEKFILNRSNKITKKTTSYSLLSISNISIHNLLNRKMRSFILIFGIALSITLLANILLLFKIQEFSPEETDIILLKEYQYWLSLISLLIGFISVGNSVMLSIFERLFEIGTLRTSGCSSFQIIYLFAFELFIISIIGGFVGSILGFFAIFLLSLPDTTINNVLDIFSRNFFDIYPIILLTLIFLSLIITLLSSIPALFKGSRYKIVETLSFQI